MFYTLLFSFTSGIFLRSFFILEGAVAGVQLLIGSTVLLWAVRNRSTPSAAKVIVGSVALCGVALGIGRYDIAEYRIPKPLLAADVGTVHSYSGQVVGEPEAATNGVNLTVQIGHEQVLVKVDRHTAVRYGDTVTVVGKVSLPQPFMTDTGREFDYPGYLRAKGIAYTMSFAKVTITDNTTGNPFLRQLLITKEQFIAVLQKLLPEPQVGLGEGLLLGVTHSLGDTLETIFRRAGIIHIVVLSGYNITLVVQFVLLLLARVLPLRARAGVGIVAIICFAVVVGLGASVVRASLMAALGLVAVLFGRSYTVTRALFLAGAGMLLVNPYLLVSDLGFQLSFMATFGLLFVSPQLMGLVTWLPKRFGLQEFFLATLSTQIAVLPLLLYYMGQFSLISLVVNMLVLPTVSVAMLLTFLAGLVGLFSLTLALPLAYLAYVVLTYIIQTATSGAAVPFAVVNVPLFPLTAVGIFYGFLGYWLYWSLRRTDVVSVTSPIDLSSVATWTIVDETDSDQQTKTERAQVAHPVFLDSAAVEGPKPEIPIFFR